MTPASRFELPHRPRRLRRNPALREMVAETELRLRHLVQGHFVLPGAGREEAIASMPGISRYSADLLVEKVGEDLARGVRAVMLFGVPEAKDAGATGAVDPRGEVPLAVQALKQAFGDRLIVMVDVCLCPYTDHGHCGFVEGEVVVNDASVAHLAEMAKVLAAAGADFVCPSDMMDGRVGVIRAELDEAGYQDTAILAYSAKYASAFYGPFRDAAGSAPGFGDRKSYQMDPRNHREALRELHLDLEEGADMVMVKPALAYLDIIADVAAESDVPVVAYNVSGEFSMVKVAAREGLADEQRMTLEVLGAIRRAGADLIITYHASQAAAEGWID
ncbi:MAG: porphobilinogen synthase [Planctomycetes bacterium]|nr:porphobilinogen synthase [Planctomycetota bacterium]